MRFKFESCVCVCPRLKTFTEQLSKMLLNGRFRFDQSLAWAFLQHREVVLGLPLKTLLIQNALQTNKQTKEKSTTAVIYNPQRNNSLCISLCLQTTSWTEPKLLQAAAAAAANNNTLQHRQARHGFYFYSILFVCQNRSILFFSSYLVKKNQRAVFKFVAI